MLTCAYTYDYIAGSVVSPHNVCRKYALLALGNYSSHTGSKLNLAEVDIVKCFMNLAVDNAADVDERLAATYALANSSAHAHNHPQLASFGILLLKTVFDVFEKGNNELRTFVTQYLANIASTQYALPIFADPYVLSPLIKLARITTVLSLPLSSSSMLHLMCCGTFVDVCIGASPIIERELSTSKYNHTAW
jgi:hypothetical protein